MEINLIGAGIVNSFKPYCRKHVINSLDVCEFALLNTIIIGIILIGYIIWSSKSFGDICNKYCMLSWSQIFSIVALGIVTVVGTLLKLSYDKETNPTFTNEMIVKGITGIVIIMVGILCYNETYTFNVWIGIAFILYGLYLINH